MTNNYKRIFRIKYFTNYRQKIFFISFTTNNFLLRHFVFFVAVVVERLFLKDSLIAGSFIARLLL